MVTGLKLSYFEPYKSVMRSLSLLFTVKFTYIKIKLADWYLNFEKRKFNQDRTEDILWQIFHKFRTASRTINNMIVVVPDGLACCIMYNSFSNSCLQKSCPPRSTNSAPFTKGWQHTTQTKHWRWNTCDCTRITSARGSNRSPHREHFTPNFLQYK